MKTTNKIHKLGLLLTILMMSTISFCFSDFIEHSKDVKDIKAELKSAGPVKEKELAKKIEVKSNGIKYDGTFIPKTDSCEYRVLTVRLTVYWARGGDTDSYSSKLKSSTGYTLKQGDSVAVDPKIIPYQSEVIIPNVGLVKAVDTGTAVKQRVASKGKLPVIDVFFVNKRDAIRFVNNNPKVVKVAVLN